MIFSTWSDPAYDTQTFNIHILAYTGSASTRDSVNNICKHMLVDFAPKADDLLSSLHKMAVDALLIDTQTDYDDLIRVIEQVAHGDLHPRIPVIMLSHGDDDRVILAALRAGASDIVSINSSALVASACIEQHVLRFRQSAMQKRILSDLELHQTWQDRLIRMVTHDLKHPMANIRMAEDLLRRHLSSSTDGKVLMDSILNALDSMQEVLEDFADASLIRRGMAHLNIRPVHVERVIYDSMMSFMASATNKNMKIELVGCDTMIMADSTHLSRAVGNLISNAIKYSPPGSGITVKCLQNGQYTRINVIDQGPGIPEDEQHLLYTEFGKLSTRPTGEETSTGLGLWIVKMLVESMGGVVGIEPNQEGGSIFWIELPGAE